MTELFTDTVLNMMTTTAEPEDYTGEDGLLYCGKCRTAKEAYFPKETAAWLGHDKHPTECDCQREKRLECESAEERRRHLDTVMELKRRGFRHFRTQRRNSVHAATLCGRSIPIQSPESITALIGSFCFMDSARIKSISRSTGTEFQTVI